MRLTGDTGSRSKPTKLHDTSLFIPYGMQQYGQRMRIIQYINTVDIQQFSHPSNTALEVLVNVGLNFGQN